VVAVFNRQDTVAHSGEQALRLNQQVHHVKKKIFRDFDIHNGIPPFVGLIQSGPEKISAKKFSIENNFIPAIPTVVNGAFPS
jgi:hypothetical protein